MYLGNKMRPKLTIGIPTFDDFDGAYFTLQSLRLHHDMRQVELIVVDNKPDSEMSSELKQKVEGWFRPNTAGTKYIAAAGPGGPSAAKHRVFTEASGEAVLCLDSHVILAYNAVAKLIKWFDEHPESTDLIQGPLLLDHLSGVHTHFIDTWRGEMWGIWGSAWEVCPNGERVSVIEEGGKVKFLSLETNHSELTKSTLCGRTYALPEMPYAGHEQALKALGWRMLGWPGGDDEFEIPGQGMGLFACRKEAWPGFNEHFRGFGGEEMYIHEKFRQRGGRCLCLGFLKWLHRFARPGGVKYPLTRWNKVRNYVIGHQELGLPLDRVFQHYVTEKRMAKAQWEYLLKDPVAHVDPPTQEQFRQLLQQQSIPSESHSLAPEAVEPDKPKLPPLRTRLANFSKAAISHVTAGAPTCSDEQIAERLSICRTCDQFKPDADNPEIGACGKCGCPVSDLLPKFVSKLAWADQHCPLEKW